MSLRVVALLLAAAAGADQAPNRWTRATRDTGLPGNEIQNLKQDDKGTVWICTLSGLATFSGGRFSVLDEQGWYWDVLEIGPDKYWLGTSDGAVLLDGGKKRNTLRGNTVAPLVRYDSKTVWAIAKNLRTEKNALVQTSGEEWEVVTKFKDENVTFVTNTPSGKLWLSVEGNGLYEIDPKQEVEKAVKHLEGKNVTAVFEDSRKRLWAGTWGQGVFVYDAGKWTAHLLKEKSAIFAIREDGKGNIWVATSANGLWRREGDKWMNDLKEEGGINMMDCTSDGRIWISSGDVGGLRYWDGAKWVVALDIPLPIRCILETRDKKLWAGGVLDGVYIRN